MDATILGKESRDRGKVYYLTEMPSAQTERWARRALAALARSGMEIPDDVAQAGIAGVASLGIKAFAGIDDAVAEQLLGEMFECVQIIRDESNAAATTTKLMIDEDIEEVGTRVTLRMEVFALHTGFSVAELRLKWTSAMKTTAA